MVFRSRERGGIMGMEYCIGNFVVYQILLIQEFKEISDGSDLFNWRASTVKKVVGEKKALETVTYLVVRMLVL